MPGGWPNAPGAGWKPRTWIRTDAGYPARLQEAGGPDALRELADPVGGTWRIEIADPAGPHHPIRVAIMSRLPLTGPRQTPAILPGLRDAGGDPVDGVADLVNACVHGCRSFRMRMRRAGGSGSAAAAAGLAGCAGFGRALAGGGGRLAQRCQPGRLGAGGDAELGEDLVQVIFDGPRADKQLPGDLPVGRPAGGQPGDLQLLGGELGERGGVAAAGGLAAGAQLGPGAAGPPGGAELLEPVEGGAQVAAGLAGPPGPPQRLPARQLRAGPVERAAR